MFFFTEKTIYIYGVFMGRGVNLGLYSVMRLMVKYYGMCAVGKICFIFFYMVIYMIYNYIYTQKMEKNMEKMSTIRLNAEKGEKMVDAKKHI